MAAPALLLAPPVAAALARAAAAVAAAATAHQAGQVVANQMADANEKAKSLAPADTTKTCEDCERDPCKHLERGNGAGPYRGGSYRQMKLPKGDGLDAHHAPPKAILPNHLEDVGPAIQMDVKDHKLTRSYGRGLNAGVFRQAQAGLLKSGGTSFAIESEIADIRRVAALSGNPIKYDEAIAEMKAYADCLQAHGKL